MKANLARKYAQLMVKYRESFIFSSAQDILSWDMMINLPPRGINLRSHQVAIMNSLGHRMATDPAIGKLLDGIEQDSGFCELDAVSKRNVLLIRKSYEEQTAVPEALVTEMARQSAITYETWRRAKPTGDWKLFLPELEKNVELAKRKAEILTGIKGTRSPYDSMIDNHESGVTAQCISKLFEPLLSGLRSLIERIEACADQTQPHILKCRIPIELQRRISTALAEIVGYDVTSSRAGGRIDETEHPFTSGCYDDVRIATHYYECDFTSSVFSILHEAGHALYEQGLAPEWMYMPVGTACSTGFHESQSRFVENIVGRSRQFWAYFLPKLKEITGPLLSGVELEEFVRAVNNVQRSRIRAEADEVTYSIHGIIRFNIEMDLFGSRLEVKDLPERWKECYREYLGVEVDGHAEGIMQDVHWADGSFGYFPCYVMGSIYDGHLLERMNRDVPEWTAEVEKGNLTAVKEWLNKNVHSRGNLLDPSELIRNIAGQPLSTAPYLNYLTEKYAQIYGF